VRLHTNLPPTTACHEPMNHIAQFVCWVRVGTFQPLPTTK
jgi:hypothetical protein